MRYALVFALCSLWSSCAFGQITIPDCFVPVERTCVEVAAVGLECDHGPTHQCSLNPLTETYRCVPGLGMEQTTTDKRKVRTAALPGQSGYVTWTENVVHNCGIMHTCACNTEFTGCVSINSAPWGPMTYVDPAGETDCAN